MGSPPRSYNDAASRWAGVGPYYAMFPVSFADNVISQYTNPGDVVLDPFAGRGTAIFSAAVQQRTGIGIEINPVGYVYAKAKLSAAIHSKVVGMFEEIGEKAASYEDEAIALPEFFHWCFSNEVRRFLVAAQKGLNWRKRKIDRTAMALLLVNLHGKRDSALSNQMRQTKSMSPQYAVRWWKERNLGPPELDPVNFMKERLRWRYARGIPATGGGHMYLGNSVDVLKRLQSRMELGHLKPASLLLTSPPYYGITNYHYDQWLRLWLLGGPPNAFRNGEGIKGKFENREYYRHLLKCVFTRAANTTLLV